MDTVAARTELRSRIWRGGLAYPTLGVTRWTYDTTGPAGPAPTNLDQIDKGEIDIYDATSTLQATAIVYVWHPVSSDNRLALHCTGHSGTYAFGLEDAVDELVGAGITVAGIQLPPGNTTVHNTFPAPTLTWNPLALFAEPGIRVLNELAGSYTSGPVGMCGLSGGAWTTQLLMALDRRIVRGVAVAGSIPLWAVGRGRDYEQWLPGLGCDYPSLYVMAADSAGRRLINLHNDSDTCCFARSDYADLPDQYLGFERTVSDAAANLGGFFELGWTGEADHIIGASSLARITSELAG